MRQIDRFWKALDDIPFATTDAVDWRARLGQDFNNVSRYLRRTGEIATSIDCPSPGQDGCPRNVVRLPGGDLRAVCGACPSECESIDLSRDDVAIWALDHSVLAGDLARSLDCTPEILPSSRVLAIGRYIVVAGFSAPVLLALPGPRGALTEEELCHVGLATNPAIILTPRANTLPPALRVGLTKGGHLLLSLSDVTYLATDNRLALLQPPDVLLAPVRERLLKRVKAKAARQKIAVPPGTTWRQITLTLTSAETLICSVAGTARQMDPRDFDMRSAKNSKTTAAWWLLRELVATGGVLNISGPSLPARVKKQKQELANRLRQAFGITSEPLPWSKSQNAYVAQFIVRDDRPKAERGTPHRR